MLGNFGHIWLDSFKHQIHTWDFGNENNKTFFLFVFLFVVVFFLAVDVFSCVGVCACACVCACVCVAIILVYNLSPLSWGNYLKGKKDKAKSVHEARYSRMQIMTLKGTTRGKCFESMSFQFAWFSLKLRIKLYRTLETFYLSSFYKCYLKKPLLPAAAKCTVNRSM